MGNDVVFISSMNFIEIHYTNTFHFINYQLNIIGSSIPIYAQINVIHISLAECYYTFNYNNHWDPGLFTCQTLLYNIVEWCCIS